MVTMMSTVVTTVVKMLETLPEATRSQVLEHLREYIADLQDDLEWDGQFGRTREKLVAAARQARQESPFDGDIKSHR